MKKCHNNIPLIVFASQHTLESHEPAVLFVCRGSTTKLIWLVHESITVTDTSASWDILFLLKMSRIATDYPPCPILGLNSSEGLSFLCTGIVCGSPGPPWFKRYLHGVSDARSRLLLKFRSETHGWNEELGRHGGREGKVEGILCGAECKSV